MIGIIGAMAIEIDALAAAMEDKKEHTTAGMTFTEGKLAGVSCVVVQCGAGKVNAAMCAQALLMLYHPTCVINIGVAGGIGPGVHIGDLVVADRVVQYDYDTTAIGEPLGFLSRVEKVEIPCDEKLAETLRRAALGVYDGAVHAGPVATGDTFVADPARVLEIGRQFGAMACEMEGGSIGQVCWLNGVPFAVLRAISDNANESGGVDFMTFARRSAEKSQQLLCKVIGQL